LNGIGPVDSLGFCGERPEPGLGGLATVATVFGKRVVCRREIFGFLRPRQPVAQRLFDDLAHASIGARGIDANRAVQSVVQLERSLHRASMLGCWVAGNRGYRTTGWPVSATRSMRSAAFTRPFEAWIAAAFDAIRARSAVSARSRSTAEVSS